MSKASPQPSTAASATTAPLTPLGVTPLTRTPKPFTGRHMAAILVAFFGVVVTVNFTMARLASQSFGGQVVDNSYVASQKFNTWLDEAEKEKALGWSAEARRRDDNRIAISFAGTNDVTITAVARHPLGLEKSQAFSFARGSDGTFVSRETLAPGRWRLRIEVSALTQRFRTEQDVR